MALAVFLIFATFGPASSLANSVLAPPSWTLAWVLAFLSGGMAGCIVLANGRPWLLVPIIIVFMIGLSYPERIAGAISGHDERIVKSIDNSVQLTPEEFQAIRARRLILYVITTDLIALGWIVFVFVLNTEGKKRGRLEAEMNIARKIQQSLLPQSMLNTPWCRVSGLTVPASEVGGDYFDAIKLSDNMVAVVIADVSGHGVGAGIISAMTKSALNSQLQHDASPGAILANLNETLVKVTDEKTFVTCAYVLLNRVTREIHIATAGHPPVLYKKSNGATLVEHRTPNVGLGMKSGIEFEEETAPMSAGDLVVLYTDGIIEARRKDEEQFGSNRLQEAVMKYSGAADVCSKIIQTAQSFSGAKDFTDDATVVSINITA